MVIYRNERVNPFVLNYIINNKHLLSEYTTDYQIELVNKLLIYSNKLKDGVFKASYTERGATLNGRIYSKLSLQSFPCEVRNSLTISNYFDIDIQNSQHSFYLSFAKLNNLKCDNLENYVNNRLELLKESKLYKKDITAYVNGDFENEKYPKWLKDLKSEYLVFAEIITNREQELIKFIKYKGKKENLKGQIISQYYCIQEKIIIDEALKWCDANNYKVGTLIHDGFLIEKDERIIHDIKKLNEYIKFKGFDVNFAIKKMDKILDIPQNILYKTKKDYEEEEKEKYKKLKDKFELFNSKILNPLVWITTDLYGNKHFEKNGNIISKYIDWVEATENGQNMKFTIWTQGGNPKTFIENYILDPFKKSFQQLDFIPDISLCNEKTYNLFDGFNYEKLKDYSSYDETDHERFKKLLNHFKFIVDDNSNKVDEYFKYLIQFFAHIILNPTQKSKVLITLKSKEGYGKNILTDFIGKEIMNPKYHLETRNAKKEIFGDFNGIMEDKLFVVFDETDPEESKYFYDKLKGEITNDSLVLKKKGIENTTIKSFTQYMATTNNELPFKLSKSNRRFVLFECTKNKPDHNYFDELAFGNNAIMKDPKVQKLFIDYLKNIYDKNFNFSVFPKSKFYNRSYELCKVPIDDFYNVFYQEGLPESFKYDKGSKKDYNTIQLKTLYEKYKYFLNDNSGEIISQLKFKSLILENEIFKLSRNNLGLEVLLKKEELKSYLEKNNIFEKLDVIEDTIDFLNDDEI